MTRRIAIHIDRITIDAVHAGRNDEVAASIEHELQRHLATSGVATGLATMTIEQLESGPAATRDIGAVIGARIGAILTGGDPS